MRKNYRRYLRRLKSSAGCHRRYLRWFKPAFLVNIGRVAIHSKNTIVARNISVDKTTNPIFFNAHSAKCNQTQLGVSVFRWLGTLYALRVINNK